MKNNKRRNKGFQVNDLEFQKLEERQLLAANLFIDFGDNFPGGTLTTTQGGLRDIADAPADGDRILGVELEDDGGNFNAATPLDIVAQTFTANDRARMMAVVERAFEPLDINVFELSATPQTTPDGRIVTAASSMNDVINTLRGGNTTWKDAYIFVAEFQVDPGTANEQIYTGGGGTSPSAGTLGVQTDLQSGFNNHDDLAVVYSGGGFTFNAMNNISHEAGHVFGLRHSITNAVANATTNLFHQAEIMSYRNTNNTTSSMYSRFPMIRGDNNTPVTGLVDYNDIGPRNAVTYYDQLRNDGNVLANPDWTFVSGTGAHDIITITRNGNQADVTVQAFAEATFTTPIVVPGEADTVFSYSIPLTQSLLIYAGDSNDQVIIDGDLGVDITIDGMRDSDSLQIRGKGATQAVYRPSATNENGADLVADFGGTVTLNGQTITFRNFDLDQPLEIANIGELRVITPNGNDTIFLNSLGTQNVVSGSSGGISFIPIAIEGVNTLVIDTATNDAALLSSDTIQFTGPLVATGLQNVEIRAGDGDDTLANFIPNLSLPVAGGQILFDGGAGNDLLRDSSNSINDFLVNSANGGAMDSVLQFQSTENLRGSSGDDTFEFTTSGSLSGSITGSDGNDVFDYSAATNSHSVVVTSAFAGFGASGTVSGTILVGGFFSIDEINASIAGTSDGFTGLSGVTTWTIDGSLIDYSNVNSNLKLENFDILNGSNDVDTFDVNDTSGIVLNGNSGEDIFNLNSMTITGLVIDGGNDDDVINGFDGDAVWNLTGFGAGNIAGVATFTNVEDIVAGAANDTFNLGLGLLGIGIDGGGGDNRINGADEMTRWSITGSQAGFVAVKDFTFLNVEMVQGGSLQDNFFLPAGSIDMNLVGNGGSDSIFGADVNTQWNLNIANGGEIGAQNVMFSDVENFQGGIADDTFTLGNNFAAELIDGNDGDDEIVASDLSNVYRIDRSKGGNSQVGGYMFQSIEKISAGAGDDQLRLLNGNAQDIEFVGGDGSDSVYAFDQSNSWLLRANQRGSIPAKSITFSEIETAVGGDKADRFMLGNGDIGINIEGRNGTDVIRGPQLRRTYTVTGPWAGDTGASNVEFTSLESIIAGDVADQFVFANNTAMLKRIDGRAGGDTLDYSSRGQVQVRVDGYGTTAIQEGFDGRATGLTQRFINIDKILASQSSAGDQLTGAQSASTWVVNSSALSFYRTTSESLIFEDFEKLRGGDQVDRFIVTPTMDNPMTIVGGAPSTAPGDILKVNLATASNAQWRYFGPGAGRFTFSSHEAISYFQIEKLDNFDFGDAAAGYQTLAADNGARHRLGSPLRFGNHLDPDADGQPSANGSLDDTTSLDDEDGVWLPSTLLAHFRASAWVRASHASQLDAWIDFDGNGSFTPDEQIANGLEMKAGANRVEFSVPLDAQVGSTMSRFRLSSQGNLGPQGPAQDGEVEDHAVQIYRVADGTSEVLADPYQFGNTILVMAGTTSDDNIVVNPTTTGMYQVKINGKRTGLYSNRAVDRVGAYGLQGTDTIVVTSTMANEGELYGDEGNDSVFGGAKRDFILGGDGNDKLYGHGGQDQIFGQLGHDELFGGTENDILSGGRGNDRLHADGGSDILFGGFGADWLYGQTSSDLLVGNSSTYDNDVHSLESVRKSWNAASNYRQKVLTMRSTFGLRIGDEVQDDRVVDRFFGGTEQDMFADVGAFDEVDDIEIGEFA